MEPSSGGGKRRRIGVTFTGNRKQFQVSCRSPGGDSSSISGGEKAAKSGI